MTAQQQWPFVRTVVMFFGGLFGVLFTVVVQRAEHPTAVIICGGMMGLPMIWRNGVAK